MSKDSRMTKDKLFLAKACLRGWCRIDDNWNLSSLMRYFYTAKAVSCILLDRVWSGKERDWYKVDFVLVAMHSFQKFYSYEFGMNDASFTNITVGYGVLSNWFYKEMPDGWL